MDILTPSRILKLALLAYNAGLLLALLILLWRKDHANNVHAGGRFKKAIAVCLVLLCAQYALYVYAQYIETNWIQVDKLTIKNASFPDELRNLKIVHISDPHIKRFGIRERLMVARINSIYPDVILVTGDFLNERRHLATVKNVFSKLNAKRGIYAILGDNDLTSLPDPLELKIAFDNIGARILDNQSIRIPLGNSGVWIVGLTPPQLNPEIMHSAYSGVKAREPKIVLTHYPQLLDSGYLMPENADLVLSGGTHGGQVGLGFIRKFFKSSLDIKYISGYYKVNGVPLYVSRGIGAVGDMDADTIRFFCRPEITVITFDNK